MELWAHLREDTTTKEDNANEKLSRLQEYLREQEILDNAKFHWRIRFMMVAICIIMLLNIAITIVTMTTSILKIL
jgi:predicted RNA binding protein with dsRBD fold (UPF0201 family)